MKKKKAYVSPKVVRVKLEASQAVLSQCSAGSTKPGPGGPSCNPHGKLKADISGDSAAIS